MKRFIRWGFFAAALVSGAAMAQGDTTTTTYQEHEVKVTRQHPYKDTGIYGLIGGGLEGFTGKLAPNVQPGVTYGAELGLKPVPGLGIELGYNGGLHDLDAAGAVGTNGADVVRNAGQAALVLDAPLGRVHPYLMGGIGINHYNVRTAPIASAGFKDDTNGYVPTGAGVRVNVTHSVNADLRATYNFPFSDQFAPFGTGAGSGRYQGLLQIGGQY